MGAIGVTAVVAADCAGLWRRTLLIGADGSRDTSSDVMWLQGPTAYVDSRGFAGTLNQHGDVFEWRRDVDLQPPLPRPDAGVMSWSGNTLVETGVYEHYVEHWVRDLPSSYPSGAVFFRGPDGSRGLLIRVGGMFGWACGDEVVIDSIEAPRWAALAIGHDSNQIRSNGVRWIIERAEGAVNL
jgi:hypothetical protein